MTQILTESSSLTMNEKLVLSVLQEAINQGVVEFSICPGSRNSPFVVALSKENRFKQYFWYEERSAAFFALGRSKLTKRPVAIITTSGTAAGELLPAAMEAYYTGIPLLLITADRPRRYRGTGAPQTAEQVGLFGQYASFSQDLAEEETCDLSLWTKEGPAHLNVCLDEPLNQTFTSTEALLMPIQDNFPQIKQKMETENLHYFLQASNYPFVVVSALQYEAREPLIRFLINLNAPVYLEAVSGLREDSRLQHLRITRSEHLWKHASQSNYPIDGILRIGGVPTFRLWRDLEEIQAHVKVCSISDVPFSGLSRAGVIHTNISQFFQSCPHFKSYSQKISEHWLQQDRLYQNKLQNLFNEEPEAEQSLFAQLSKLIPKNSLIFLGNSLPIREWDSFASLENRGFEVNANRGLNGIDGQVSTFLGMCSEQKSNWAILGDLTTLYDMAGPWILQQLEQMRINLVVVNNGGGKIFARMYPLKSIQNPHHLSFKPLAEMWGLGYAKFTCLPHSLESNQSQLIEIIPNEEASNRFWKKLAEI